METMSTGKLGRKVAMVLATGLAGWLFLGGAARAAAQTFTVGPGAGGEGRFQIAMGGAGGIAPLLMDPAVQRELKMTSQQVSRVQQRMQAAFQFDPANTPPAQAESEMRRRTAELERAVAGILSESQLSRARQISLQSEGGAALAKPEVADQLELTADQRKAVAEILRASQDKTRSLMATPPTSPSAAQAVMRQVEASRKEADSAALALLTDTQQQRWKNMTGKPFQFSSRTGGIVVGGQGGPAR